MDAPLIAHNLIKLKRWMEKKSDEPGVVTETSLLPIPVYPNNRNFSGVYANFDQPGAIMRLGECPMQRLGVKGDRGKGQIAGGGEGFQL